MAEQLSDFHFIRPIWLLLILGAFALYRLIQRQENVQERWGKVIAPHLLKHLVVGRSRRWQIRPVHLVCAVFILGAVAMAGPTWERELPPFTEDKAPMVIVLDLSQTMDAIDVQPTRLERAKQKIGDLLKQRPGARNALFVYSGSVHMVLPLTEDPAIMELFLFSLSTDLMPVPGKDATAALKSAHDLLAREEVPGTILFVTDGVERKDFSAFLDHRSTEQDQLIVLGVGTSRGGPVSIGNNRFLTDASGRRVVSKLDVEALKALGDETGALVTTVTIDEADVKWIQRRAQSHLQIVQQEQAQTRWRDFGYYLVFPLAFLTLLWFRRGWTVKWAPVFLIIALSAGSPALAQSTAPQAADSSILADLATIDSPYSKPQPLTLQQRFLALWLTDDQQGRYYFERENYALASQRFQDPFWRGLSLYYKGDYESALNQFALLSTAGSFFNLGNCYARLQKYEEAVASYDEALAQKPDFPEAVANRQLIAALIEKKQKEDEEESEQGDPNLDPDEIKFDEKGEKGKKGKMEMKPEQMAEIWMRNIQTTPADFLRLKFLQQAQAGLKKNE